MIGLNPEQATSLGLSLPPQNSLNYFELMELRSKLELPDLPDDSIQSRPELSALSMCEQPTLQTKLQSLSVLTLDHSIRHARAQDWEEIYGVTSAETIREIVSRFNDLPTCLMTWQDNTTRQISHQTQEQLLLADRALVVFAAYLKSVAPKIFTRWQLTLPPKIKGLALSIDPFIEDTWESLDQIIRPVLSSFREVHEKDFEITEFSMEDEDPIDELTMESILGDDLA
ncbi:hypothetical protein [Limnobacter sp.]|uniref:hypothetical protein n=1 Tax=Limnobacter sp. TaxID=2003368 RepID=UPI002E358FAA|nr:hypothetical protein [Limnobacter sp.]